MIYNFLLVFIAAVVAQGYAYNHTYTHTAAHDLLIEALARAPRRSVAPVIESRGPIQDGPLKYPVVLMHGIGDSSNSAGMESLVSSIKSAFPGTYVISGKLELLW